IWRGAGAARDPTAARRRARVGLDRVTPRVPRFLVRHLGAPVPARAMLHFCMPHQVRAARSQITVNYTMFEADRIPERWVRFNTSHDLVIVPTASSRDAGTASGFPAERVRVCPLGVDAGRFHGGAAPLALTDREGRRFESIGRGRSTCRKS